MNSTPYLLGLGAASRARRTALWLGPRPATGTAPEPRWQRASASSDSRQPAASSRTTARADAICNTKSDSIR